MLGVHEETCERARLISKALRPQTAYVSMSTPPAAFSEVIGVGKQQGHQNRPRLAAAHASLTTHRLPGKPPVRPQERGDVMGLRQQFVLEKSCWHCACCTTVGPFCPQEHTTRGRDVRCLASTT